MGYRKGKLMKMSKWILSLVFATAPMTVATSGFGNQLAISQQAVGALVSTAAGQNLLKQLGVTNYAGKSLAEQTQLLESAIAAQSNEAVRNKIIATVATITTANVETKAASLSSTLKADTLASTSSVEKALAGKTAEIVAAPGDEEVSSVLAAKVAEGALSKLTWRALIEGSKKINAAHGISAFGAKAAECADTFQKTSIQNWSMIVAAMGNAASQAGSTLKGIATAGLNRTAAFFPSVENAGGKLVDATKRFCGLASQKCGIVNPQLGAAAGCN